MILRVGTTVQIINMTFETLDSKFQTKMIATRDLVNMVVFVKICTEIFVVTAPALIKGQDVKQVMTS